MISDGQEGSTRPLAPEVLSGASQPSAGYTEFADLVALPVRRPRLVLGVPLLFGIAGLLYFRFFGSFAAESTFAPQDSQLSRSSVAAMASRFGIGLPGALSGPSVEFYGRLLASDQFLAEVARSTYRFPVDETGTDSLAGTAIELYGIKGDTPGEKLGGAIKLLRNRIAVSTDFRANVVTIRVKAPWRALAQHINRRMLDLVNRFNVETRQSQGGAERRFAEVRRRQALEELTAAEDEVERFFEANRSYQTSPRLVFQLGRLQRRVELRQQVYASLSQAYENARIEEVRDTPVITVVSAPETISGRSRNPFRMGLMAFAATFVLMYGLGHLLDRLAAASAPGDRHSPRRQVVALWWSLRRRAISSRVP